MSERNSEYERQPDDAYYTPQWCFDRLHEAYPEFAGGWDCAPRDSTFDFLKMESSPSSCIVTNPPFGQAEAFICHALRLTYPLGGNVAMLLPHGYDCAKGRAWLFKGPPFKAKITLLRRIRWENLPQKKSGPSKNHCWLIWDWAHTGPAEMKWVE
jgi:hypothetical protein